MKKYWPLFFGTGLITVSAFIYCIHYLLFGDLHHILLYLVGDIAFVPIQVLLVTLIIHKLLEVREKKVLVEKLRMLVGVFFSEAGNTLINYLAGFDRESDNLRQKLKANRDWREKDFQDAIKWVKTYKCNIEIEKMDLEYLAEILKAKRSFLVTLLQNPVLLEHEMFTGLVRNLFHLEEEFSTRLDVSRLSEKDRVHIKSDVEVVYNALIIEWIGYLRYLNNNFPNLFMFMTATNPFTKKDSIDVLSQG